MIRDRCPKVVDIALKWCKAKERWIDHVYKNFVNPLLYEIVIDSNGKTKLVRSTNEVRKNAVRCVLGIADRNRNFDFYKTICWENLDDDEVKYWESIYSWVNWFQAWDLIIQQDIQSGATYEEIREKYCSRITNPDKFAKYLFKTHT